MRSQQYPLPSFQNRLTPSRQTPLLMSSVQRPFIQLPNQIPQYQFQQQPLPPQPVRSGVTYKPPIPNSSQQRIISQSVNYIPPFHQFQPYQQRPSSQARNTIYQPSPVRTNFRPNGVFPIFTPNRLPPQQQHPQQPMIQQPQMQIQFQQQKPIPQSYQYTFKQPQQQQQAQLVNSQQYQDQQYQITHPQLGQEDDLEKKFEEAISRTKQLVTKYQKQSDSRPYLDKSWEHRNQAQAQPKPPQQQKNINQANQSPINDNNQGIISLFKENQIELALQYEDGYIYRGQGFEPSTREGFGVLTDQNENEVYNGFWKDNQYHGQGKLANFQAEQIQGSFDFRDMNNIENGWIRYEGEFNEGKMHGFGVLFLTNGEKYEGEFNDGMIDGEGVFYTQDNEILRGIWSDGMLSEMHN